MPRTVNARFNQQDFDELKQVKGDRSWETAMLEEFGVKNYE